MSLWAHYQLHSGSTGGTHAELSVGTCCPELSPSPPEGLCLERGPGFVPMPGGQPYCGSSLGHRGWGSLRGVPVPIQHEAPGPWTVGRLEGHFSSSN